MIMIQNNRKYILYAIPSIIVFTVTYIKRDVPIFDDAFIFYRYADNWAAGYGPVFNTGEFVEGYSSFLWTAILASGSFLSFDVVKLAPILNYFIGLSCLVLTSYISGLIKFSRPYVMGITFPLFCSLSAGFIFYGMSGMDTLLFLMLLMLSIAALQKTRETGNYIHALPFLLLLTIARAEGFIYAFVLMATITTIEIKEKKGVARQLLLLLILFSGFIILFLVTRYHFYNELMPATVYAKGYSTYFFKRAFWECIWHMRGDFIGGISMGLTYVTPLFFMGIWFPFVLLLLKKNEQNVIIWLIAACIALNIFIAIWAAGDWMPHGRYFIAVLPLLLLFMTWALDYLFTIHWNTLIKRIAISIALIFAFYQWFNFFIIEPIVSEYEDEYYNIKINKQSMYQIKIGKLLSRYNVPTTLVTDMNGVISYYSGPNVYVRDMLGLTDIHNAKHGTYFAPTFGRSDLSYTYSSPFDLFVVAPPILGEGLVRTCQKNPDLCSNYRFYKNKKWNDVNVFVFANEKHPVATALEKEEGAVPMLLDEEVRKYLRSYSK